ncbi:MAG: energy transducer TonB [Bacteroidales bacterium]|nr:energy transducer TonB [Bacteroidales bacterium]
MKDIRREIARANDIEYITSECTHKGECAGTCPKCEAEVRYLEEQLSLRRRAGQTIALAGMMAGAFVAVAPEAQAQSTCCSNAAQVCDTVAPIPRGDVMLIEEAKLREEAKQRQQRQRQEMVLMGDVAYVDTECQFRGGDEALQKFIRENLKQPADGKKGKVKVQAQIMPDGSVGKVKVKKKLSKACDAEAVRVVKMLPNFFPCRKNGGKAVESTYMISVVFE